MANMTREEAIRRLGILTGYEYDEYLQALEFAITDMERVEKLEEMVENLNAKTIGRDMAIRGLMAENKRLTEGIEKAKAEIETLFKNAPSKGYEQGVCDVGDLINKYLGE